MRARAQNRPGRVPAAATSRHFGQHGFPTLHGVMLTTTGSRRPSGPRWSSQPKAAAQRGCPPARRDKVRPTARACRSACASWAWTTTSGRDVQCGRMSGRACGASGRSRRPRRGRLWGRSGQLPSANGYRRGRSSTGSVTRLPSLIVDAQVGVDDLVHWGGPTGRRNNPDAEEHLQRLVEQWRAARRPVAFTLHDSWEQDSPLKRSLPTGASKPGLEPRRGEIVVVKHVNGAFFGTDLEIQFRRAGVRRLVVGGYFTNFCVETTVRTAGNIGFDTYLCHRVRHDQPHRARRRRPRSRRRPPAGRRHHARRILYRRDDRGRARPSRARSRGPRPGPRQRVRVHHRCPSSPSEPAHHE